MALSSVRVLDLSRVLAGPLASQILGDFGASVINIEHPSLGDITRKWGPPFCSPSVSAYFCTVNRNKYPYAADLRDPHALQTIHELASKADVLIENFVPGKLEKYKLDYTSLASLTNNRIIYASLTGYGQTGPRALEPGFDFVLQAQSGLMSITGPSGSGNFKVGSAVVDVAAGNALVQGILAALYHRDANGGTGQHISVSLLDAALTLAANRPIEYLNGGGEPLPLGNSHPTIAPYDSIVVGSATDNPRHVVLAVGTDRQFEVLAELISLTEPTRYKTNSLRIAHRTDLLAEIEDKLKNERAQAFVQQCLGAGIPAGLIHTIPEALSDPQTVHNSMIVEFPDGVQVVGSPIHLSVTPVEYRIGPQPLSRFAEEEVLQLWE